MVDVVTNHMGYNGAATTVQYSTFNPFNSQSYYHPYCAIDLNNITSVQDCWTGDDVVSLPDLRTENSNVQAMWNKWITQLVQNYTSKRPQQQSFRSRQLTQYSRRLAH